MASSYVGGLSGAFIPVSEDQGMIDAVTAGALTLEKLEAMTCVMLRRTGYDRHSGRYTRLRRSPVSSPMRWRSVWSTRRPTAVRLIPVIGKGVGETVEFGGLLGYAPIMPVNPYGCDAFVNRKGRIPAPVHSFKN